jgi:hypothetical protein
MILSLITTGASGLRRFCITCAGSPTESFAGRDLALLE